MHARSVVLVLGLSLAAGAAPGCRSIPLFAGDPEKAEPTDEDWQETEPLPAASFDQAWSRTRAALETMDYPIDEVRSDVRERRLVTKWRLRLGVIRLEGSRRRAHVELVPAGDRWIVRAAVIVQQNADIKDPTNPVSAKWEDGGTDPSLTGRILHRVRSLLLDEGAGE